jgi:small subunit ribosomal protein S7
MRSRSISKRKIKKDVIYSSELVEKFINRVMLDGKKSIARKIFYNAIKNSAEELKSDPFEVFTKIIENVSPAVEVRSRRVGGANYQVPIPVAKDRQSTLAIRWIVAAARNKRGSKMEDRLAKEFLDAYKGEGMAMKKKMDVERMAEANKAFSHFA